MQLKINCILQLQNDTFFLMDEISSKFWASLMGMSIFESILAWIAHSFYHDLHIYTCKHISHFSLAHIYFHINVNYIL
jgi:preprotein translocase subunit SecA